MNKKLFIFTIASILFLTKMHSALFIDIDFFSGVCKPRKLRLVNMKNNETIGSFVGCAVIDISKFTLGPNDYQIGIRKEAITEIPDHDLKVVHSKAIETCDLIPESEIAIYALFLKDRTCSVYDDHNYNIPSPHKLDLDVVKKLAQQIIEEQFVEPLPSFHFISRP